MTDPAKPRKTPCASCPYRRGTPSGVWDASEYEKLPRYDGDIPEQQSVAVFNCHMEEPLICAGWLGHRDPTELLAVRVALVSGHLDADAAEYTTDVPLFASGAEAAAHGMVDIADPGAQAQSVIDKLTRIRDLRR